MTICTKEIGEQLRIRVIPPHFSRRHSNQEIPDTRFTIEVAECSLGLIFLPMQQRFAGHCSPCRETKDVQYKSKVVNCSSRSVDAIIFQTAYILTMILRDGFHPKQIARIKST